MSTPAIIPRSGPPPARLFERLGLNHGLGVWRVQVDAETFTGATESEALIKALSATYHNDGPFTIIIEPRP
jgi:hypothetical protein